MVTRISKTFNELKLESQTGLITYLTAGFPNQDLCLEIINELSKSGSDLIEIGMPFSDPMAEGPIIQHSSKLSLDNGHTMELTFELINKFRENNTKTPIILMGYYNPIYQYGNHKPRIFRLEEDMALINRLGFNNSGSEKVRSRIVSNSPKGLFGINIGPNKDTNNRLEDYLICLRKFYNLADYLTINISSPNTENLRSFHNRDES